MTDSSWTIHTKSNGSVTLPGAIGDSMPTFGAGRDVTLLLFAADSDDTAYQTLREYARYTNESTSNTGIDIHGKPWFYESIHPTADYESALVRLEPGADIGDLRGWWCVITDASIQTNAVGTAPRVSVTLYVLAEAAEYTDRQLVTDEFEAGL
ncbi:hypothetical protein HPS36_14880 [Halorubrum salinarum]|uniref:Uncharacterized protein n=1 Tax=Halorubrum salinarum TaxID=2739057 RepID=A0A7D3Y2B6_9EURY|nr:hypothetical protein [Halorubrum salinarum]QKG94092.1 hypothetical protein HPS36_14880 [Halorubrum salinarum]